MLVSSRCADRRGFTLIELLVVLAIIAVLISLTAAAVLKFMWVGPSKATDSTIRAIKSRLETQWNLVAGQANRENIPPGTLSMITANLAAGDAETNFRARVIYVKLRLRQSFPINFAEVINPPAPFTLTPLNEYMTYLGKLGFTTANAASWPTPDVQNAVCLKMALELGAGVGGANKDELNNLSGNLGTTPNGASLRGLVDGYGTPLAFCRWPTGFANPNPNNVANPVGNKPYPSGGDPVDPKGYLSANTWAGSAAAASTAAAVGHPMPVAGQAFKLMPVVASAGVDKALGLNPGDFSTATLSQTIDNKYTTDY
jgi:prepilin-type N-terminal cleavage/methylation domain-containing protein